MQKCIDSGDKQANELQTLSKPTSLSFDLLFDNNLELEIPTDSSDRSSSRDLKSACTLFLPINPSSKSNYSNS